MNITQTALAGVLIISPKVFHDKRGYFFESFNQQAFNDATGTKHTFVQDNHSRSHQGTLRGLHYQIHQPQGKLLRVVRGAIFDVAVDLRTGSSTFGLSVGVELSEDNQHQLWIPPGFAHGHLALSDCADVIYKTTNYYAPQHERSLLWSDPQLNIPWPIQTRPVLSDKDAQAPLLKYAEVYSEG